MYCKKCGAELMGNEIFCGKCGALVEEEPQPWKPYPPGDDSEPKNEADGNEPDDGEIQNPDLGNGVPGKNPVNKKVLAGIGAAAAAVLIIGIILAVVFGGGSKSERKMEKALDSGDIAAVVDIYEEYADSEENVAEMQKVLCDYIDNAKAALNREYTYDSSSGDVEESIQKFISNRWAVLTAGDSDGNVLCNKINSVKNKYGYSDALFKAFYEALEAFRKLAESKAAYYRGLNMFNNVDSVNDYLDVVEQLSKVSPEDSLYEDAAAKIQTSYSAFITNISKSVDEYIAAGDLKSAISLLENLGKLDNLPEELKTKLNEIRAANAEKYMQKAADEFAAGNIDAAIGNVEAAITLNPNGGYQAKLNEYAQYLTFELYEEDNWLSRKGYGIGFSKSEKAVNNTEYKNCLEYRHTKNCDPSTISFLLEGKYDIVSGVYFSPKVNATSNRTGNAYFEAYGDGKLLYTSPTISAESLPTEISFTVTGVQKLEIKFIGRGSSVWGVDAQWYGDYAELSELIAKKNVPAAQ